MKDFLSAEDFYFSAHFVTLGIYYLAFKVIYYASA